MSNTGNFDSEIAILQINKKKYKKTYGELKQLLNGLPDIKEKLVEAEECFKNGGYIDNYETFDRGKLKASYIGLDNIIDNINNILIKIENKETMLDSLIADKQNKVVNSNRNFKEKIEDE